MPARRSSLVMGVGALALGALAAPVAAAPEPLTLRRETGAGVAVIQRRAAGTVHAQVDHRPRLRVLLAIPEENTGAGLWLAAPGAAAPPAARLAGPVTLEAEGPRVVIRVPVEVEAPRLRVEQLLLGSVRRLRDYARTGARPRAVTLARVERRLAGHASFAPLVARLAAWRAPPSLQGGAAVLSRPTLDGRHHLGARVLPGEATTLTEEDGTLVLASPGPCRLVLELSHDLPRLDPLTPEALLAPAAARTLAALARRDPDAHRALLDQVEELSLLAYRDRYLAGSWRFLTYFGRDTLLSMRMLAPVLADEALVAGLRSVLWRLSPEGMVAHEEDLGDQAALDRLAPLGGEGAPGIRELLALRRQLDSLGAPVLDTKMVDDDLLLVGLACQVLGRLAPAGRLALLDERGPQGISARQRLLVHLEYLLERLEGPWIPLREGLPVGDWRDSEQGLGGGRYAFSVNGALPEGAARNLGILLDEELLGPRDEVVTAARRLDLRRLTARLEGAPGARVEDLRRTWRARRRAFRVTLGAPAARARLGAYLASLDQGTRRGLGRGRMPDGTTLAAWLDETGGGSEAGLTFHALALGPDRRPVEVMHSDAAMLLLDLPPWELEAEELEELLRPYLLPFPLGLRTPFGFVVANPGLDADPATWTRFDRNQYHGAVIWGWQLALLETALTKWAGDPRLAGRRRLLWDEVTAAMRRLAPGLRPLRHQELWTWRVGSEGEVQPVPYGAEAASATEANALQLWNQAPLARELQEARR